MTGETAHSSPLLLATVATPLAILLLCLSRRLRPAVPALLTVAPLPGLAAALLSLHGEPLAFDLPQLRLSLALDIPGAMMLGSAALLWSTAGAYAAAFLRSARSGLRFVACWLLTMSGSLGVFVAADLVGFYLVFALVSLPAYGLIIHDDDAASYRAGSVYIAFTVLGEALLLMGFALLAAGEPTGSSRIRDVMAALPHSPWHGSALVLTGAGFVLKMGLVPVHGWMPLSYTAAPIPAASVLSGAAVKAGVIGLIRFLPADDPAAGEVLVLLGLLSSFYGVVVGVTQSNPKTVLAYSSISQMGVIAVVLGMGLTAGDDGVRLDASFYAAHHVLAKGALFMAIGVIAATPAYRTRPTLVLAAVLALGLGGLPLTAGALSKAVVKASFGQGAIGVLALASTVGTNLLMMQFLSSLAKTAGLEPRTTRSAGVTWAWRATATASVAVPWLLFAAGGGDSSTALAPAAVLASAWPVAAGVVLWFGFARWADRLPRIPEGDFLGMLEQAFRAIYPVGVALGRIDKALRRWPAASLSLIAVGVAFFAATVLRA